MSSKISRKLTAAVLSVALPISGLTIPAAGATQTASAGTTLQSNNMQTYGELPVQNEEEAFELLSFVDSIPDEVLLAGDEATYEWIKSASQDRASGWGCAKAIGELLLGAALPASRLLKLKRAIKALGGVSKAVQAIKNAGFSYHAMMEIGGAIKEVAEVISGVGSVRRECFN